MIALLLALAGDPREADVYAVDYLKPPDGAILEIGGLGFLPDGRLVASTRRGEVWIVDDPLAKDPADARFHLFADGLQEGLGLAVVDGAICVLQRGEISRLLDVDGDGRCDRVETIADGWGVSGHYHEFAFGLPVDAEKNFYVSLNVSFGDPHWWHGRSTAPWRGWILRIAPDGAIRPFASGFRSPCGLGLNEEGDLFETDNQGDWMPACPIFHVKEGAFHGHPASLAWTDEYRATSTVASDTVPPDRARARAAVWLPYKWSRSTGNLVTDTTAGKFGPFAGQMVVAELTNGLLLRAQMEKVRGEWQGACFLLRQGVGSAVRVAFGPDGTLFCGLTNRGWGGLAPAHGIARVRWTGRTPFEMQSVHLLQDGFEIRLTKPLAAGVALSPANVDLTQYRYDWWWEYGSPERDTRKLEVSSVAISADRTVLAVHARDLRAGEMARLVLHGARSDEGEPLLHDEFAYTINELPDGPPCDDMIARLVPPPPARETDAEGWLRLCHGDAFDQWNGAGWRLCDAELDPADASRLVLRDGTGALVPEAPGDFESRPVFGDAKVHVEFMLPEGGGGALALMGRHEILFSADKSCGALGESPGFPGRAPALDAWKGPGIWHDLDLVFRAPRVDAGGREIQGARFEKVLVDDILLHEGIDVPSTGGTARADGPLLFRAGAAQMALGGIRVKPLAAPDDAGWTPLFDGEDLAGWKTSGDATWTVDDGMITSGGGRGHLFSPRADYRDLEVRALLKISDGGNSGLYVRTAHVEGGGEGWPVGYEAQVNSSHPDPQRTGGLYGLAPVKVSLVGPDTWFEYRVRCEEESAGTRVQIRVNGTLITDFIDPERRHAAGHVALQQHHEGSVLAVRAIEVREIRR